MAIDRNGPQSGFTLIEIMVVVTIIGVLVSILSLNFNDARMQARDNARKSDLQTVQLALETYKAQNGTYPAQGCGVPLGGAGTWAGPGTHDGWGASCEEYIIGLTPDFIPALPKDPNQEYERNKGYIYMTDATQSAYKLLVYMSVESQFVNSYTDEFARCPRACGTCAGGLENNAYGVYSPGAECW